MIIILLGEFTHFTNAIPLSDSKIMLLIFKKIHHHIKISSAQKYFFAQHQKIEFHMHIMSSAQNISLPSITKNANSNYKHKRIN